MSDTQQRYDEAKRLHEAGRHGDAHAIYMEVLKTWPNHADTLHMLGVLEFRLGISRTLQNLFLRLSA